MKKTNSLIRKMIIYLPMIVACIYVLVTLIIFKFGVIRWKNININKAILYVLGVYTAFSMGYCLYICLGNKYKKEKTKKEDIGFTTREIGMYVFRVGAIVTIVYSAAWLIFYFGLDIWKFIVAPGATYDYTHLLEELYGSGKAVNYPQWIRWISRFNTILNGVSISAVCIGTYIFGKFRVFDKILYSMMLIMYIARVWMLGKQSSFLILFLEIVIAIGANFFAELYNDLKLNLIREVGKKYKKRLAYCAFGIAGMLFILIGLIVFMQNDRTKQRAIRTQLYNAEYEKEGTVSSQMLKYFVVESIEMRTGYSFEKSPVYPFIKEEYADIIVKRQDMPIIALPGNNEGGQIGEETEEQVEARLDVTNNFTNIDIYYTPIERQALGNIPSSIYYGLQSMEMYLTNGYASMALALDLDFTWSYLIGNSRYCSSLVENLLGVSVIERTYPTKNEKENGWNSATYSNTLYTWFASDLTFWGVIIAFAFYGFLFAKVWVDIIDRGYLLAIPMCYLISYSIVFSTQNNMLTNTMGAIFTTFMIVAIYIGGNVIIKWLMKRRQKN